MILLCVSIALFSFIILHAVIGSIAWAALPCWTKAKYCDSDGRTYYEIIGKLDYTESSLWQKVRHCFDYLSEATKAAYHGRNNPLLRISAIISFLLVCIHRTALAGRLSHDELDSMLAGEDTEPVSKEDLVGLLKHAKFAKWAYPFHKDHKRLESLLLKEGFVLIEHERTTSPGKVSHYIAINQAEKNLLIVPRGSCAVSDFVTNFAAIPEEQTLNEAAEDERLRRILSHGGFLAAANTLADYCTDFVECLVTKEGYRVDIVGHSLGAAVATLMGAILLSRIPALKDPSRFHIWSYASPPCLDEEPSQALEPYLSTVVWNRDIVPTLGVSNYYYTCKLLSHVNREEGGYHGRFAMPRALVGAILSSVGWNTHPLSLPEERLDHITKDGIAQLKSLQAKRDASKTPQVYLTGSVIYLWQRRHKNQPTGEVNGAKGPASTFFHLHMVVPTKESLSDHFVEAYEDGLQQLLDQMGDRKEHRRTSFLPSSRFPKDQ